MIVYIIEESLCFIQIYMLIIRCWFLGDYIVDSFLIDF